MGKKSRKQTTVQKSQLCSTLSDKMMCRYVDELWEKTTRQLGQASGSGPAPPPLTLQSLWQDYDSIAGLLLDIQQRQGSSPAPLPPREEGMDAFEQWINDHGGNIDLVKVTQFPGMGYGLRLKRSVQKNELVLTVPVSAMMTVESAKKGPLNTFISQEPLLTAMPNLALALHLLNERYSQDSAWRPFINILPHSYSLSLYFNKETLNLLQSSPVLSESLNQIKNISRLYSIIHRQLRQFNDPSLALCSVGFHYIDFIWAVSSVMSRVNKVPVVGEEDKFTLALIPLWDMANHTNGVITTDFEPQERCLKCYSLTDSTAGEEFKIFYGQHSNADLFLNSGFVFMENKHDVVKIKLGLSSGEEPALLTMRKKLLQYFKLEPSAMYSVQVGDKPIHKDLLVFARIFTATPDQLTHWLSLAPKTVRKQLARYVWSMDDCKVLQFLENRCSLLLRCYKTTIEDDKQLLTSQALPECSREAVKLRLCEKLLLRAASDYALQQRLALEKPPSSAEAAEATASQTSSTQPQDTV